MVKCLIQAYIHKKVAEKAKDARKVSFVLVVVYEDLLNWVKKLVFSTSLWVWVWAKGKSTCLLCDFVNNTFWPRGSEGKKSSPQDRCLFQNLKMFIFQHNFAFHILLHWAPLSLLWHFILLVFFFHANISSLYFTVKEVFVLLKKVLGCLEGFQTRVGRLRAGAVSRQEQEQGRNKAWAG